MKFRKKKKNQPFKGSEDNINVREGSFSYR